MRGLLVKRDAVPNDASLEVSVLRLGGFINASTIQDLQGVLSEVVEQQVKHLILDFASVEYVNSSGVGLLVKLYDDVSAYGGKLVLVRVHRTVGKVLSLLGLTSMVSLLKDEQAAVKHFLQEVPAEPAREPARPTRQVYRFDVRERALPKDFAVLMVVPSTDIFSDILRMHIERLGGRIAFVHDCRQALHEFDRLAPYLVILEDSMPGSEDFLEKLKIEKQKSLVSVIKLYPRRVDPLARQSFKIWEDDYMTEPFDMMELFALSQAELARAPTNRQRLSHQLHFSFKSTGDNLNSGLSIGKNLIGDAGFPEELAVSVYAAFQEAVDNALRHGNRHHPEKRIDVIFQLEPDQLVLEVEDEGDGFDYDLYMKMATEHDAVTRARITHAAGKVGGLGIKLMMECSDEMSYNEVGNRLRLVKRIAGQ